MKVTDYLLAQAAPPLTPWNPDEDNPEGCNPTTDDPVITTGDGDTCTSIIPVASQWVSWAMWIGLSLAILSAIILGAMMAIDRNRGEAGIASSDQARWLKWAFGVGCVSCAPQLVAWFIDAFPW